MSDNGLRHKRILSTYSNNQKCVDE